MTDGQQLHYYTKSLEGDQLFIIHSSINIHRRKANFDHWISFTLSFHSISCHSAFLCTLPTSSDHEDRENLSAAPNPVPHFACTWCRFNQRLINPFANFYYFLRPTLTLSNPLLVMWSTLTLHTKRRGENNSTVNCKSGFSISLGTGLGGYRSITKINFLTYDLGFYHFLTIRKKTYNLHSWPYWRTTARWVWQWSRFSCCYAATNQYTNARVLAIS